MKRRHILNLALVVLLAGWTGSAAAASVKVFVSVAPQKTFVEKIGGPLVDVSVMVAPGASPATYEPRPRQMAALSEADIYFAIGVPFEKAWLPRIASANRNMKVVHCEQGFRRRTMSGHGHGEENHHGDHHEGHHDTGMKDPHVWLSPRLVAVMCRTITQTLAEADPDHAPVYKNRYQEFLAEIVDTDARILEVFEHTGGRRAFMVYHPAWGYFADAYGLAQIPIENQGKEPSPADLGRLVDTARSRHIKVIFAEPQFSTKDAKTIARSIGGEVVLADPLAENWSANLLSVAEKFRKAMEEDH